MIDAADAQSQSDAVAVPLLLLDFTDEHGQLFVPSNCFYKQRIGRDAGSFPTPRQCRLVFYLAVQSDAILYISTPIASLLRVFVLAESSVIPAHKIAPVANSLDSSSSNMLPYLGQTLIEYEPYTGASEIICFLLINSTLARLQQGLFMPRGCGQSSHASTHAV